MRVCFFVCACFANVFFVVIFVVTLLSLLSFVDVVDAVKTQQATQWQAVREQQQVHSTES